MQKWLGYLAIIIKSFLLVCFRKHYTPPSFSKIGLKVKTLNQFESDGEASASSRKLTLSADLRLNR